MEHVMVIVPVDANINETQDISEKNGQHRPQRLHGAALRHSHLQHHDGDDDRDHPVAERLQPPFGHQFSSTAAVDASAVPSRRGQLYRGRSAFRSSAESAARHVTIDRLRSAAPNGYGLQNRKVFWQSTCWE